MFKKNFVIGSNNEEEIRVNDEINVKYMKDISSNVKKIGENIKNINSEISNINNILVKKAYIEIAKLSYQEPTPPSPSGDQYIDIINNSVYSLQLSIKMVADKVDEIISGLVMCGIFKEEE